MTEKITISKGSLISLGDLFKARLGENFKVGDKLLDIRREANAIGEMAKRQTSEDGEFAKVYADSVAEWMDSITKTANEALEQLVKVNADIVTDVPPPPKEINLVC